MSMIQTQIVQIVMAMIILGVITQDVKTIVKNVVEEDICVITAVSTIDTTKLLK